MWRLVLFDGGDLEINAIGEVGGQALLGLLDAFGFGVYADGVGG